MNEGYDDMAMAEPLAGEELERLLARYARVRLDPSPAQARRARASAMEEAWRRRIAASATAAVAAAPARARHGLFSAWSARRVGVSLSAAVLAGLMVGTSAFAASRAGGPLYGVRLAVEEVTLPSAPIARARARLEQAQARLAEAVEAAGRHDENATRAALGAYDTTVEELTTLGGDAASIALEAVRHHRDILREVLAAAPAAADNGLATALANADRVIARLEDAAASGGGPGGAGNPGGNDGNNGAGAGGPAGNGNVPGQPGKPTPNPDATARPGKPTPNPDATAKPGKPTPPPDATAKPGKPTPPPDASPAPAKTPKPHKTPNPPNPPDPGRPGGSERAGKP